MNLITRTTELAMAVTLGYINEGDIVIDATCGAGQDTVILARAVGPKGRVLAFDIQHEAIERTRARLHEERLANVEIIEDSFISMRRRTAGEGVAAVVFNLGYLPGADHNITTNAEETLEGLRQAIEVLRPDGLVTVVMYEGHAEGAREKEYILEWAKTLDSSRYHAAYVNYMNQKKNPPEILWITKKS